MPYKKPRISASRFLIKDLGYVKEVILSKTLSRYKHQDKIEASDLAFEKERMWLIYGPSQRLSQNDYFLLIRKAALVTLCHL